MHQARLRRPVQPLRSNANVEPRLVEHVQLEPAPNLEQHGQSPYWCCLRWCRRFKYYGRTTPELTRYYMRAGVGDERYELCCTATENCPINRPIVPSHQLAHTLSVTGVYTRWDSSKKDGSELGTRTPRPKDYDSGEAR